MLIDTDGHIMEPASMWHDHIDPEYRDKCVQVVRDAARGDKLVIAGTPSRRVPRLGGIRPPTDGDVPDWNGLDNLTFYESYADSCMPASYSSRERLRWMDENGVRATLLFPSLGLLWPKEGPAEGGFVRAHCRAYNRWLKDFCAAAPTRLYGAAQTCAYEISHAIEDLRELRQAGFAHVMLPLTPANSVSCFSSRYHPVWAAAQELGLRIHLHKVAIPEQLDLQSDGRLGTAGNGRFFEHVNQTLAGQMCLASIFDNRIPDLFPRLRFALHECNAGWVAPWLDRADESHRTLQGTGTALTKMPPSHYVRETGTFTFGMSSAERPENVLAFHNAVTVATDFPHPGCVRRPGKEWEKALSQLSNNHRQALLVENAERLLSQ